MFIRVLTKSKYNVYGSWWEKKILPNEVTGVMVSDFCTEL